MPRNETQSIIYRRLSPFQCRLVLINQSNPPVKSLKMSVEPRITSANPVRQQGYLDYERCAALNNEIYRLSWSGYYSGSHITWWEYFSPSLKTAETLDPSLIKFLKLALFDPKDGPSDWTDRPALFYWISSLNDPDAFFETWVEELYPGRFVWLYCATGYLMGDERGIL